MNNNKNNNEGFIPLHGGYRNLITFQKAEVIYDGTVYFTNRFFKKYDRTTDQMVQAARSGKQNIAYSFVCLSFSFIFPAECTIMHVKSAEGHDPALSLTSLPHSGQCIEAIIELLHS